MAEENCTSTSSDMTICQRCGGPYDFLHTVVTYGSGRWWRACQTCADGLSRMDELTDVVEGKEGPSV